MKGFKQDQVTEKSQKHRSRKWEMEKRHPMVMITKKKRTHTEGTVGRERTVNKVRKGIKKRSRILQTNI